ncbi:hypothetical protein PVAP13_4NG316166 [Panicum virgatum]|uniref:Uncharacterized protein n=1 Tax=Panicum virgatum TaxID=38727 RepID=A0A8T0TFI9_PANVG|nr:hypothetical protein PVAP13_4NG316166 [Panicum virgatum]
MKRLTDDSAGSGITTQQARAVQLPQNTSLLQPSHAPPLLAAFLAAHRSSASYAAAPSNLAASVPLLRRFVVFAATRHARATSPLMVELPGSTFSPRTFSASGKAYCQGWLTGEGGATLRQCSSRTGTTRLTDEACDAAAVNSPAQLLCMEYGV